jgi:hypothetical protein
VCQRADWKAQTPWRLRRDCIWHNLDLATPRPHEAVSQAYLMCATPTDCEAQTGVSQ